jgi:predicted nucleotidyltransferase
MQLNDVIATRKKEFETLCSRHKVKYLFAFGSSITDRFDPTKSDIDLLVEVTYEDPITRGEMLISLWDSLEKFFARRVDLLTDASIKNPFLRKSIDSSKVLIYDESG